MRQDIDTASWALVIALGVGMIANATATFVAHQKIARVEILARIAYDRSASTAGLKRARDAWPGLSQEQVIAIGETVQKVSAPAEVTIFCDAADRCGDLRADLDDAFQIASWPSRFGAAAMGSETDGILVGPPGAAAEAVRAAVTAAIGPVVDVVDMRTPGGLGIIIGRKPK